MKLDANDIELVEKSIDGSLNAHEALVFEEKYKSSETFREHVNFQRSLLSALDAKHKVKLKAELAKMLRDVDVERKETFSNIRWYLLAASVAIFIGFLWIFNSRSTNQQLFDKYYEPYPASGYVRGDISKTDTDRILQSYASGEYQTTINEILTLKESGNSFEGQTLYLGNSYLSLSQSENAIKVLQTINEESRYYPDAQWYLALACLEKGDTEKAIETLKGLSKQNTIYTTSTLSLLNDLDQETK